MLIKFRTFMILILAAGFLFACGPSEEELKRQQKIEDSVAEAERNAAIEKASNMLGVIDAEEDTAANELLQEDSLSK